MFRIYLNDQTAEYPLYEPLDDTLRIFNPVLTQEIGRGGYFKFHIHATHPYADKIGLLKAEVTIYNNDNAIFYGRILKPEYSMQNMISITCEGDLTYLIDSQQRPYEHTGDIPSFMKKMLDTHNNQVDDYKKIYLGQITVVDGNSNISRSETKFTSTLETLMAKLVETHGGHLRIRNENSVKYLDYLHDYGGINSQDIRFGENLLNLDHYMDAASIITCLIPNGAGVEYTDSLGEKQVKIIDITSVNAGMDYIQNDAAVAKYGKVWGNYQWKEVTEPAALLEKAKAYLLEASALPVAIEVNAIDLSLLDESVQEFNLGYWTRIYSEPHGIEKQLLLTKRVINLLDPTAGSISFGKIAKTFTDQVIKKQEDTTKAIDKVAESTSSEIIRKIANATNLITGGIGGYVVLDIEDPVTGERALPWRILIMDAPDKDAAMSVIQINKNGIGFSTTGINGPYNNAWTIDGNLVADFITAGTMLADRIRGGMLELGGSGLGRDGKIVVKDADDKDIGYWDKTGLRVLLGEISGTTIRGSSIIGGMINIGNGTFIVDKDGSVVIESGEINIGPIHANDRYVDIGGFRITNAAYGAIMSTDEGKTIGIYSSEDQNFENGPAIVLDHNGYRTRIGRGSIKTGRIDCDDIYLSGNWWDGWSLEDEIRLLHETVFN